MVGVRWEAFFRGGGGVEGAPCHVVYLPSQTQPEKAGIIQYGMPLIFLVCVLYMQGRDEKKSIRCRKGTNKYLRLGPRRAQSLRPRELTLTWTS